MFTDSVYYYTLVGGQWSRQSKLISEDGGSGDEFGHGLAMYGTNGIMGASDNSGGS